MASAYTILCDRLGPGREIEIAQAMRRRAPHASPNALLVRHADEALGRGGRMVTALDAMGQPLHGGGRRHSPPFRWTAYERARRDQHRPVGGDRFGGRRAALRPGGGP